MSTIEISCGKERSTTLCRFRLEQQRLKCAVHDLETDAPRVSTELRRGPGQTRLDWCTRAKVMALHVVTRYKTTLELTIPSPELRRVFIDLMIAEAVKIENPDDG